MPLRVLRTVLLIALAFSATNAAAFNPPSDTQGAFTARIDGPAVFEAAGKPVDYTLVLENSGATAVDGEARFEVIDDWRVEVGGDAAFRLDASGTHRIPFRVVPGPESLNALYPVHAFVSLGEGKDAVALHPVLIAGMWRPDPPRPTPDIPWKPVALEEKDLLYLAQMPVCRRIMVLEDSEPVAFPPGTGGEEPRTRMHVRVGEAVTLQHSQRSSIIIHPPWHGGHRGSGIVEFPVRLPESEPISLGFYNAIRQHRKSEPPSDGVTFRVRVAEMDGPVLGEVVYERHTDAKEWKRGQVDLAAWAGKAVRLQLESHPGPDMDTTCDLSYWGSPQLGAGLYSAYIDGGEAWRPPGEPKIRVGAWTQADGDWEWYLEPCGSGLLHATNLFRHGERQLRLGGINVVAAGNGLHTTDPVTRLKDVREESEDGRIRFRHSFDGWTHDFDLMIEASIEGNLPRLRVWLENAPEPKPWQSVHIEDVHLSISNPSRIYAGVGNVLEDPQPFRLHFDGHQMATSFVGYDFENGLSLVQAMDVPPDYLAFDGESCSLHAPHAQTITLLPAQNVWQAAARWGEVDGKPASPGVEKLAGRFVFDLWGGRYAESRAALERAMRYGVRDAVVVWHNWQRWGYDYRLPDIWPPNPNFGTLEEFQALADTCMRNGFLFAPHDNYIDFYPDAEDYSYDRIAFTGGGQPIRAWFNKGRGAQAYRWRPDCITPFVERNLELIRDGVAPNSYFIDVFSSMGPHDYWTRGGRFVSRIETRRIWGETFAWIRDYLGDAPQISESGHDQLVGWLDGAQANHLRVRTGPDDPADGMVWEVPCADAERIPWIDAAHHAEFALHGAGYSPRYTAGLDARLHGMYSDDYICTEVLTGHPGMVHHPPFGRQIVRKFWLTDALMHALALKRIGNVVFADGDIHRQAVRWENGVVRVNRGKTDWNAGGHVLPQYGFHAQAGPAEAAIERLDGVLAEWARDPEFIYVNARTQLGTRLPVSVSAERVEFTGDRTLEVDLAWQARAPLAKDWRVFVHFMDASGGILFQADHAPPTPATQWDGPEHSYGRTRIPDAYGPGSTFELRAGLYEPGTGVRAALEGANDGRNAIRLGKVRLDGEGDTIKSAAWEPRETAGDPYRARMNPAGKALDFGGIITDGACRLYTEDGALCVMALPDQRAPFMLKVRPASLPWKTAPATKAMGYNEAGGALGEAPLRIEGGWLVLECRPGVHRWRLIPAEEA